jgi:diguanylate cyclase (GGDEF)-like protein
MPLSPRSIGTKLFWVLGVPGLCVALVGSWHLSRRADEALGQATRNEALALAEFIASTFTLVPDASAPPGPAHGAVSETIASPWRMYQHVQGLRVVDPDGVVRWSRVPSEVGQALPEGADFVPSRAEAVRVTDGNVQVVRALRGADCQSCHRTEATLGYLQVTVGPPAVHQEVQAVFGLGLQAVVILFGVLLTLLAVSLRLLLTRPLGRLAAAMGRAEQGDFLVRAEVRTRDEIGALAHAFNRMLAKITSMKAEEIDAHRDLERVHEELSLKRALEESNGSLQLRVKEQSLLFDVARSLTSTIELPEVFGRISTLLHERLGIPRFSIMLFEDGKLVVKSAFPVDEQLIGLVFEPGRGACGRAANTLTAVYIPDLEVDAGVYERRPGERVVRGSLLTVPMIHKGALLGVLNYERPQKNAFGPEEIELLAAVADLAAIATKNALLHEQTVALSITDPLTGTANRRHLFSRLEMEVARSLRFGTPLSLLMVDIDHFKHLNDEQGHRVGDEVLKKVADLLRTATRKVDVLARYGGEEFMLVLPQATREEAMEVAEKLRRAIAEAPIEEGRMQPLGCITVSIGVSTLHRDGLTLESVVDAADAALYASKRGGRNRCTGFEVGMELHPGRERGPHAARRRRTGETEKVGGAA